MSTASARDPQRLGRIGISGLVLTVVAAFIRTDPNAGYWFSRIASLLVEVLFQVTIVAAFLVGLAVIVYSQWKHGRGELTENVQERTAVGVLAVFVLSLGFPLVLIDDIARLVVSAVEGVGPSVSPEAYFLISMTVFGLLTLVGVLGVVRRRIRLRRV